MGRRGPAPKPTSLKLIQGTYRKDRAAPNEPRPDVSIPKCPTWLSKEAKREWKYITPHLASLGLLTMIDRAAIASYCQLYAEWVRLEKWAIDHPDEHYQVASSGYLSPHPNISQRDKVRKDMLAFLREFGLTPAARTRVSVPEKPKKESNPFAALG